MRRFALAVLLAGLLAGCQLPGDDSATTQDTTTTTGGTVTERADERAAEAQAPRVREILEDLWGQFDMAEKPLLDDKAGDGGGIRLCTFDVNDHITSWAEGAGLRVSQEENPELEAQQAELVRVWLDENGWERIDSPAPTSTVTYHRNDDGFFVKVAPQLDARVFLDVESPCFNDQGERVVGTITTTTTGGTVTERADERAAEAQAPQVRAILQDLWDQFDLPDKPSLDDKPGDGRTRACTLDTMTHITSWAEGTQLRVSQEENPELEAQQAELVRVWLDDNGWERIDSPAPTSTVTYHRNDDGFFVTVSPQLDARVNLDVESPCFNDQGERVVGSTSRNDR